MTEPDAGPLDGPDGGNTTLNLSALGAASRQSQQQVSPLEQEVLDEYERLSGNMRELSETLTSIAQGPLTVEIAEGLRLLERKVASVYTLMKASVYSIVLQQGAIEGEGEGMEGIAGQGGVE